MSSSHRWSQTSADVTESPLPTSDREYLLARIAELTAAFKAANEKKAGDEKRAADEKRAGDEVAADQANPAASETLRTAQGDPSSGDPTGATGDRTEGFVAEGFVAEGFVAEGFVAGAGECGAGDVDGNDGLHYAGDLDLDPDATVRSPPIKLSPPDVSLPVEARPSEALRLAIEAFPQTGNWVTFYRLILGADGVCRKLFPDAEQMRWFETTEEFMELNEMVAALRSEDKAKGSEAEPERMITIRIPRSVHDVLKLESEEHNLSINKVCVSKLLQRLHPKFTPLQKGKRRGRRPGPQGPRRKVQRTN